MYSRLLSVPKGSFFLFGPRGTGKSTWLSANINAALTINLLNESIYQEYLRDLRKLSEDVSLLKKEQWVVIDEVQRLPHLLNEVHLQIEQKRLRFALTGSSARSLRAKGVNLLAGRAVMRHLHPFVPSELGGDFHLMKAIRFGTTPLILSSEAPSETLQAYAETYLKEEIQAESHVRNLPGFARFLRVAALMHGQVFDATRIATDAGVARTTVQGYIEILKDTLIGHELPAWDAGLRVRERKKSKFYFFDSGVVRALKGYRGDVAVEERGPLLEGMVHQWLIAHRDYEGLFDGLYYWASGHQESRVEVDFLLSRGSSWYAIEVKSAERLRPDHFRGLQAISELRGLRRRLLLYMGHRTFQTEDGILVLPVGEFFLNIRKWLSE